MIDSIPDQTPSRDTSADDWNLQPAFKRKLRFTYPQTGHRLHDAATRTLAEKHP